MGLALESVGSFPPPTQASGFDVGFTPLHGGEPLHVFVIGDDWHTSCQRPSELRWHRSHCYSGACVRLDPQQKILSASPAGSPSTTATMLEFCDRHQIAPQVEYFLMSRVNEAIDHLRSGKARYRVVLDANK